MNLAQHRTTLRQVEPLLRDAAAALVVPRWRRLQHGDASEKSPGEWVTIVDREVEEAVSAGLLRLMPDSIVVGEESCTAEPHRIDSLGSGIAWLVDPLDGTANFIAGRPPVSLMVALLEGGDTVAAWMLDPLTGTMHRAEKGGGAWRDGERVFVSGGREPMRRGIVKTRFLPEAFKAGAALALSASAIDVQAGSNCAGTDYPDVADAASDFALYWRTLPWDHAPGALFLTEAGGHVARLDGSAYRPGEQRDGLLVARSRLLWEQAQAVFMQARPPSETSRSAPGPCSS
ncbi:MAG TPA: inositol monophosphatase family protein [Variovorax sp.]